MFSKLRNKKYTLAVSFLIGLLLVIFTPVTSHAANNWLDFFNFFPDESPLVTAPIYDNTSIPEAKAMIENYKSQAKELTQKNDVLKEEKLKIIKLVYLDNAGGSGTFETAEEGTTPENEKRRIAIQAEIDNNDKNILRYRDLAASAYSQIIEKATTEEEKRELENISAQMAEGFVTSNGGQAETECWSWYGGFKFGQCFTAGGAWVSTILIYFFGSILYLAGEIFSTSILLSVTWVQWLFTSGAGTGIDLAWRVVRDFSSLFFVFILLYVAIGTIFDLKGISDPKKIITNVVIIALLVNFSGFFVRVVVDASNIVAMEFYNSIIMPSSDGKPSDNIGSYLVKKLAPIKELASVRDGKFTEPKITVTANGMWDVLFGAIIAIFVILIASFVLIVASVIFIIRIVTLIFLYIVSPFAITSKIFPGTRFNYFESWSNSLIKQSLMAPAFLIPLYLVYLILESGLMNAKQEAFMKETGTLASLASGAGMTVLMGIIICGLLIACILIAQKVSAIGGEAIPGLAGKAKQMLSRPVSRYGGRLANRMGSSIANSPLGQRATNSWNNGSLRLVRRSWDTGVLKTARESEYGKRAGKAIRNPLTTALGVEPFSVDTRAKSILEGVKRLETDEQKSRFVEGLAGFRGREEFDYIYDNMSNEDRRKVELAAQKVLANPDSSSGAKAGARMVANRMEENRKKLKGKKAQDIAIELVKKSKDAQKLGAIEHLGQEDLNEVFKGLSRDEGVVEAMKPGATTALVTDDIRKISREKIVELDPRILTDPGISQHLTTVQLEAIRNSDLVDDINKDIIRTNIEGEIKAARAALDAGIIPRIPRNLEKLSSYFKGGVGSGF